MTTIISVQIGRFLRARSQTFNVIRTPKRHIIVILGSTGNAYLISITRTSITCNCPNQTPGCKHILFLLSVLGFLKKHQSHITIRPLSIVQQYSRNTSPELQACYLDHHTNHLCLAHQYGRCFFCAKKHSGSIIICSECGYLAHKHCYHNYLSTNIENSDQNYCPKCGYLFTPLDCNHKNSYRNYFFVLEHRNYCTDLILNSSASDSRHPLNPTNCNCPHFQSIIRDI